VIAEKCEFVSNRSFHNKSNGSSSNGLMPIVFFVCASLRLAVKNLFYVT